MIFKDLQVEKSYSNVFIERESFQKTSLREKTIKNLVEEEENLQPNSFLIERKLLKNV